MSTDQHGRAGGLELFTNRFAIDPQTCDQILQSALERGGDYADLFFEYTRQRLISLEDQSIKNASSGIVQGMGVRVVRGESVGYAYTEQLDLESMRKAARTAANIAVDSGSDPVPPQAVAPVPVADRYPVDLLSIDERGTVPGDLARRADEAARSVAPSVHNVIIRLTEQVKDVLVATSEGRLAGDTQPLLRLQIVAFSQRGSDRQHGYSGVALRSGLGAFSEPPLTPEILGRQAAERAILGHGAVDAPAGFLPVVLAAGDSGVWLHEAVGHGLEADFSRKRLSNYSDRIGQQVASKHCTVIDDGTLATQQGSINIDDEGQEARYSVLIENGILRGYMHDWISARHFGVAPSGNGRRQDFRYPPMPRMTSTYMLPGEADPDDVVRAVKRGVYCVSFSGGQVNISSGDYVFSTMEAYLIEDGKVTAPLKTTNLIGNGPDSLNRVTMVGNDLKIPEIGGTCGKDGQWAPVSLGLPTVLVDGITVGGTGQ